MKTLLTSRCINQQGAGQSREWLDVSGWTSVVGRQMSHQERKKVRAAYIHKVEHLKDAATDVAMVSGFSGCKSRERD